MIAYSSFRKGDRDPWGSILKRRRGCVTLWETPKGYFGIYLSVPNEDDLYTIRKHREVADDVFEDVCNMLPNLPPEES